MIVSIFFIMSFVANAEQALSKALIEQYFGVINQFEMLNINNSPLIDKIEDVMMLDKDKAISVVKSLDIYPEIAAIVESAGFSDFGEFVDIGYRTIGSMYAVQLKKHPELMQMQNYPEQVEAQLKSMKERNAPQSVIDEIERGMQSQQKSINMMKKAAKDASVLDKKFVENNFGWLMNILPGNEE